MRRMIIVASASGSYTYEFIKYAVDLNEFSVDIANIDAAEVEIDQEKLEFYKTNGIRLLDFKVDNTQRFHKISLLLSRIRNIIRLHIVHNYDVINLHYITEDAIGAAFFSSKKANIVATVYGSDVLRANKLKKPILRYVFRRAKHITAATNYLERYIVEKYGDQLRDKIIRVDFGRSSIEKADEVLSNYSREECRAKFGIPKDKFTVFVGYNGNPAHKHLEIINRFCLLPECIKQKIFIVMHCSYSLSQNYKEQLENHLIGSGLNGKIFYDYLTGTELLQFRRCADILTNLQATDVLSASMLESMVVGTIIIKGDWLVYDELNDKGAFLVSIQSMDELQSTVERIVDNMEYYQAMCKTNYEIVYDMLSWNTYLPTWRKVLSSGATYKNGD